MLHDYFFAKTIDKVRPRRAVFVSSKGTMDKLDAKARNVYRGTCRPVGRDSIAADRVQAECRNRSRYGCAFLPQTLPGEEPAGEKWIGHKEVTAKNRFGSDHTGLINEYFVDHPEMVLGEHSWAGTMRAGRGDGNEYTVIPREGDIEDQFLEAVRKLPSGVFAEQGQAEQKVATVRERDWNPATKKEGALYVHSDGT
jgi:hypothetical protein